jgi:hypothetical protein
LSHLDHLMFLAPKLLGSRRTESMRSMSIYQGIVIVLVWQVHAESQEGNDATGKLVNRASKAWPLDDTGLDDATLAKAVPSNMHVTPHSKTALSVSQSPLGVPHSAFFAPVLQFPSDRSQLHMLRSTALDEAYTPKALHKLHGLDIIKLYAWAEKSRVRKSKTKERMMQVAAHLAQPQTKAANQRIAHEAEEEASKVAMRSREDLEIARRSRNDGATDVAEDRYQLSASAAARAEAASAAAIAAMAAAAGDFSTLSRAQRAAREWASAATAATAHHQHKVAAHSFKTAAKAGDWEAIAQAEDSPAPRFFAAVAQGDWAHAGIAANDWADAAEEQSFWASHAVGTAAAAAVAKDWDATKAWATKAADLAAAVAALSVSRGFSRSSPRSLQPFEYSSFPYRVPSGGESFPQKRVSPLQRMGFQSAFSSTRGGSSVGGLNKGTKPKARSRRGPRSSKSSVLSKGKR